MDGSQTRATGQLELANIQPDLTEEGAPGYPGWPYEVSENREWRRLRPGRKYFQIFRAYQRSIPNGFVMLTPNPFQVRRILCLLLRVQS